MCYQQAETPEQRTENGAVKELRVMETYKKQKIGTAIIFFVQQHW